MKILNKIILIIHNSRKLQRVLSIAGIAALVMSILPLTVQAKDNMVPNYEVKLLLDSEKVLNSDKLLTEDFRNKLNISNKYSTVGVLYVDTPDLKLDQEGWQSRIRIKEKSSDFELTYKKRYKIQNNDVKGMLDLANSQGFDISDTNYEAQVDWGYGNMTLSISNDKKVSNSGYGDMELPRQAEGIDILMNKIPGKLENWNEQNWGKDTLRDGKKYGDVYYKKAKGTFEGCSIDAEIWPIRMKEDQTVQYVTELSFKADDMEYAGEVREDLIEYLDSLGVLLHEDSLKTQLILNNY